MVFSELYSAYYNTVARILTELVNGNADEKALQRLVAEHAFGESVMTVLPSLKSEKWQLMHADMTTPLRHVPTMPLTELQKRWLKAILLDPRIRLFDLRIEGLDGVEPLFTAADYCIYDRYGDGDPYEDEGYIQRFHVILSAMRERAPIKVNIINRSGKNVDTRCIPEGLEYSEKDDKFRLITSGCHFFTVINLAKITSCARYEGEIAFKSSRCDTCYETVTLKITDERNALERCMLHFAHFEKQTEKPDGKHYLVHIRYARDDAPEMVIRILSFGPRVEVIDPDSLRALIKKKLKKQKALGLR